LFFEGGKKKIVRAFKSEMRAASKALEFERAAELRGKIFSLKHIQDIALIREDEIIDPLAKNARAIRIEGYDISNISGESAVGSMVVFVNGKPDKDEYRKFKIQSLSEPNDIGMLKEMLRRRFTRGKHIGWQLPHIVLIDGGKGQVRATETILDEIGLKIPVVGIAKGPERKKNEFVGAIPFRVSPIVLIRVRDEAHRFAISYHKQLRSRRFLGH
jgi:Nuclease subunit of the excinuclease complex